MLKDLFFCVKEERSEVPREKAFLYIGGSYPQINSIETIKSLGVKTILTDRSLDSPLKPIADHFFNIDATDVNSFLKLADEIAEKFDLIGVYPIEDYAVLSATMVAKKFNVPYFDKLTAEVILNKFQFFNICLNNDILTPKSILIRSDSDLSTLNSTLLDEFNFPIIIKPVSSWGSQGVNILNSLSEHEFYNLVEIARQFSQDIMVQELIEGTLHNVDGVFLDRKYYPCNSYDRLPKSGFTNVTKTIIEPSNLSDDSIQTMHNLLSDVANLINLKDGPVTGDFIFSDGSLYLLEISPHFHSIHQSSIRTNGIHYPMKAWVSYLAGVVDSEKILDYQSISGVSVMSSYWSDKTGEISDIVINERLNTIDIIKDVHLRYKKGDELNSEISTWNCIALIWGFSNQRIHLLNDIDLASDMITVEFFK